MRLCCSLIFAVGAFAFQPPPGLKPGVVEGKVIDSVSGEPIRNASVTLMQVPIMMGIRPSGGGLGSDFYDTSQMPASRVGNAPPTILTTDDSGSFRATVNPGRYQVRAERNGYLPAPAGVTALSLIPGETLKGVALKLIQQAIITGRVVDGNGEPLAHVRVQCLKWTVMGYNGQRVLMPQAASSTNDLGEYRIFGISPGKYIVSAEAGGYATLFAPGVPDLTGSKAIALVPGAVRQSIDFRMQRTAVFQVSGKVAGGTPGGLVVSLVPRHPALVMAITRQYATHVNPDGSFVLQNVPPGEYVLKGNGQNQEQLSGRADVDVADRNLTGLTLALRPGVTVKGRLRTEGMPPLDSLSLFLQPRDAGLSGGSSARIDGEGRFTVSPLEPIVYRIRANGLPNGYYVTSIKIGDVEARDELDLTNGAKGEVVVTLEHGTAEVGGKALDKGERPVSDVLVMAVNDQGETVRSAISLIDGQYRLAELPPGVYRIFPVVDADISDPDTLDRLSAAGKKVTLAKSARETRHLEVP